MARKSTSKTPPPSDSTRPCVGNGEQVVYRQVIINGDNNSKEALRLKERITSGSPGAKVQFQYQNAGADTLPQATFKDFSSIALKKSEILTLTPQVILKIRNHGLVEKFEAATRRNSFTAFLDSVTKALESVDHEYDLEKPLLNFLSSFKNLFLQLKNTKTDEVTKRTYALVDATNMQKLGSLTAYIDVHDRSVASPGRPATSAARSTTHPERPDQGLHGVRYDQPHRLELPAERRQDGGRSADRDRVGGRNRPPDPEN